MRSMFENMLKLFLIIHLLIGLTKQGLPQNNTKPVSKKICDRFVSLNSKRYIITGRFDESIYCNLNSEDECIFNEHKVFIELMVNNLSYPFGSVDCKQQTYDLQQETCYMKILFGIEDLNAKDLKGGNEFKISCRASFFSEDGPIEGKSSTSYLKVFRGEQLGGECSDTKPCISDRNITCDKNVCICESNQFISYYDEYGISTCGLIAKHNEECVNRQQCSNSNSQCLQTSIGKLCQCLDNYYWTGYECKYGYESKTSYCPSCYCSQVSCLNEWSFKLNVLIFICGMIAGIFAFKTCLCCVQKKKTIDRELYALERPETKLSCASLDPKELGKNLNDKLINKLQSIKSSDKSEDLENIKIKY